MAKRKPTYYDVKNAADEPEDAKASSEGDAKELDDKWLIKRIQAHVREGINSEDGEVTDVRQTAYEAYMGSPMGNERDGYSTIVTREVLQAIEWALPALMRVFLGGVKPVAFRASGPDDVQQAKLETDAVTYWFFDGNPEEGGFLVLYALLKDLLMYPNAYARVEPIEEEERETTRYTGINVAQLEALEAVDDAEVTVQSENETAEGKLYDVLISTSKQAKRVQVSSLAPDKVIIDHNHHALNVDRAKAVIIREEKTLSDIRECGYDVDAADLGPDENDPTWNDEEVTRLFYIDEQPQDEDDSFDLEADRVYWVHECFMRVDWDQDGISELRRVVMAGCAILENEPWDMQEVVAGSALPVPHKHVGMGYAELVLDLQQLMTTLTRQLLDNIYAQNIQRTYIADSALLSDGSTMDALIDGTQQYIVTRGMPNGAIMPEVTTPIVAEITGAMEALKELPQLRTGVAPQLSLDPSVLEKSTMGAFVGALEQASQRLELLARLVAETMVKPIFLKTHETMRRHFDKPQQIEVNGEWMTIDPRTWKKRASMTCNVGLGFNNKQAMLTLLQTLLMIQKEALPTGLATPQEIYNTLEILIEQTNLGSPRTFFVSPKDPNFKPPPPQPDPAMITAQATAKALDSEAKRKDAELAMKQEELKEKAEADAAKSINELLGLKGKDALTTAQIAKLMAEITALNRGDKAQAGPAEDSSADEFARAGGLVGDTESERSADREAGAKPKPNGQVKKPAKKPASEAGGIPQAK